MPTQPDTIEWQLYRDALGFTKYDQEEFEDAFFGIYESEDEFVYEHFVEYLNLPEDFPLSYIDTNAILRDLKYSGEFLFEHYKGDVYVYSLC